MFKPGVKPEFLIFNLFRSAVLYKDIFFIKKKQRKKALYF